MEWMLLFATTIKTDLDNISPYVNKRSYASCDIMHDELIKIFEIRNDIGVDGVYLNKWEQTCMIKTGLLPFI